MIMRVDRLPKHSPIMFGRHRTKFISRRSGTLFLLVLHRGSVGLSLTFVQDAHAYIGPGLGLSQIGIALSVVGVLLFLLSTAIWYPFKRLLRRRRAKKAAALRRDAEPLAGTGVEDSAR